MRLVYVDEAGISEPEPVSVVVGVVVHADTQYAAAERELAAVIETVPAHYRPNFVSHASAIWSNKKYRDRWTQQERAEFLKSLASIPGRIGIPIVMGVVRRNLRKQPPQGVALADFHHYLAFGLCMTRADDYIQKNGAPDEVATVVAEDAPNKREQLRDVVRQYRANALTLLRDKRFSSEAALETLEPIQHSYRIVHIRDTVHFVEKLDSPFLQFADVCAWGIKRFIQKSSFGAEIFQSMSDADISRISPEKVCVPWGSAMIARKTEKP